MTAVFNAIPSPSFNSFDVGPLHLRLYGLCIALGVLAAVSIAGRRWEARGGDRNDIGMLATWAVPAGVIGARAYHVATDWKTYFGAGGHPVDALKIWQGGLGIPGGIFLGVLVGVIVARRKGLSGLDLMDTVAPAIPVAQAIGRLGNWFNQELFGRPTTLPWGLRISESHRPVGYTQYATFHPTFLYEALWNLALAGCLVLLDRRKKLRRGELFTLYILGYSLGRLWVEDLRIDKASLIAGVRINIWMSLIVLLVTIAVFARRHFRPADEDPEANVPAVDADDADDAGDADDDGAEGERAAHDEPVVEEVDGPGPAPGT
ncbi:MAG: prolipoprotein diacylglyceryl transferase [Acidimicrobiales bacterium]|nr:prolipoprotein diacylglyceryl transferase [Acidimicrobiales bacterium]